MTRVGWASELQRVFASHETLTAHRYPQLDDRPEAFF